MPGSGVRVSPQLLCTTPRRLRLVNRIAQAPLLLICPVWVLSAQGSATPPVTGFVADAASGVPLVEARVEFPALGLSRGTDPFGSAYFPAVKSGAVRIKVLKIGYAPIEEDVILEVPIASAIELSVAMKDLADAHALDTVRVIGKRTFFDLFSGFERRRNLGLGKFFTSAQLDSAPLESVADLIKRKVAGVRVEWRDSRMRVRLVSLRGPIGFVGETECV